MIQSEWRFCLFHTTRRAHTHWLDSFCFHIAIVPINERVHVRLLHDCCVFRTVFRSFFFHLTWIQKHFSAGTSGHWLFIFAEAFSWRLNWPAASTKQLESEITLRIPSTHDWIKRNEKAPMENTYNLYTCGLKDKRPRDIFAEMNAARFSLAVRTIDWWRDRQGKDAVNFEDEERN